MTGPQADDALVVSQSPRRQLPYLGLIVALGCAYALMGSLGVLSGWLASVGVVTFGAVALVAVVGLVRGRDAPWELRLDREGVTVRGRGTAPWSDLAEVRITGLRPRWLFLTSFGTQVVAFVGLPGVEMPTLPSTKLVGRFEALAWLRVRWYGSQLLLMPSAFDTSTRSLVEAVKRFSEVPVRGF